MHRILYIIATPIGNLEDITFRAVKILKEADVILCESVSQTKKLLERYEISGKTLIKYTEHQEKQLIPKILKLLEIKSVALVSDAGTPGISDPGSRLVASVLESGGKVIPIPGPSALVAAISSAGVIASEFDFVGFFPRKIGAMKRILAHLDEKKTAVIGYESPYRVLKTLKIISEERPEIFVVVSRELTKVHEEISRGRAASIHQFFESHPEKIRGEFVIILANKR